MGKYSLPLFLPPKSMAPSTNREPEINFYVHFRIEYQSGKMSSSPESWVEKMNRLGGHSEPFLFILDYSLLHCHVLTQPEIEEKQVSFHTTKNLQRTEQKKSRKKIRWDVETLDYDTFLRSFQTIQRHLKSGNSYLVNLTFPIPVSTDMNLPEIYEMAKAKYKLQFENFLVFSPECFVRISEDQIYTYPMKGTSFGFGEGVKEALKNSPKEVAEHTTVVDLLRNDLNKVSRNVRVSKWRFLETFQTNRGPILQLSSEISGSLPDNWKSNLGNIFRELLPAGSITGAPKKKTLEIILEAEQYDRGFYTGVFGYFDGNSLDSAVMIRFLETTENGLIFKSGAGITLDSDPEMEYQEILDKVYVPFS